jgi:hypothetical protein
MVSSCHCCLYCCVLLTDLCLDTLQSHHHLLIQPNLLLLLLLLLLL